MPSSLIFLLSLVIAFCQGTIIGRVETANAQVIFGYACDPNYPNITVFIDARENSTLLDFVEANIHRPDIASKCGGNPDHGFRIDLANNTQVNLFIPGNHTVNVIGTLLIPNIIVEYQPLENSPVIIQPYATPGELNGANRTAVFGWACDPYSPSTVLFVQIYIDGVSQVGIAAANITREPAIGEQCGGYSNRGFEFVFPPSAHNLLSNGQPHTISARGVYRGVPIDLKHSPVTIH